MPRKPRRPSPLTMAASVVAALAVVGGSIWVWQARRQRLRPATRRQDSRQISGSARQGPGDAARTTKVQVYFVRPTETDLTLVPFERAVVAKVPARGALEELIGGAVPSGCYRPLPPGLRLLGVTVNDGLATVDFSRELIANFIGGSSNEGATVYAIVNTLVSVPGVERVQILVEGKQVESIGGHMGIRGPLTYDGELVPK